MALYPTDRESLERDSDQEFFIASGPGGQRRNKVETGREGMLGLVGNAVTELAPAGKVFVHGEYWDAVAPAPVPCGAQVRVVAVDNKLKLTVEPVA